MIEILVPFHLNVLYVTFLSRLLNLYFIDFGIYMIYDVS